MVDLMKSLCYMWVVLNNCFVFNSISSHLNLGLLLIATLMKLIFTEMTAFKLCCHASMY